tara:strand:- start:258 stop:917 length:660 start_codon:yes stop_codon:yes gene_type:complete
MYQFLKVFRLQPFVLYLYIRLSTELTIGVFSPNFKNKSLKQGGTMRKETTSKERITAAVESYSTRVATRKAPSIGIIPCGSAKATEKTEARNLYTSQNFQAQLECAEKNCDFVYILSAKYGLVKPDTVVAPYDVKMGDEEDIDAYRLSQQLWGCLNYGGLYKNGEIDSWLPKTYFARLTDALSMCCIDIEPYQVLKGNCGIGEQKAMVKQINETTKENN